MLTVPWIAGCLQVTPTLEQTEQRKQLFLAHVFHLGELPPHALPFLLAWVTSLLLPGSVEIFLLLLFSPPWSITYPYDSSSWPQESLRDGEGFLSSQGDQPVGRKHTYTLSAHRGEAEFVFLLSRGMLSYTRVNLATYLAVVILNKTGAVPTMYP